MTSGTDAKIRHIPALDGVRALAVLAVMAYHLGAGWLPGGFLGVDVFFVLSGFLISTLLLAEFRANGHIDLVTFWLRRARRLLPALFVVLAVVIVYTISRPATEQLPLRWDLLASLLYAANWRFVLAGESYFAQFAAPSPVKHLWSLAIEEQFYVVFPLILLGAATILRRHRRVIAVLWLLVTAGSAVALALLYDPADPSRAYYGTDTRVHQLLIGVGLAFLLRPWTVGTRRDARSASLGAAGGLVGVIVLMLVTTDKGEFYYHGGSVLAALATAVLVAGLVTGSGGLVGRLLATRPAVAIGTISYGLYLWHWPVIVILTAGRTGLSGLALAFFQGAVAFAASVASYLLVERPIRRGRLGRIQLRPMQVFTAAVAIVAVLAGCTLVGTVGAQPAPAYASQDNGALFVAPDAPPGASVPVVGLAGDSVAVSLQGALGTELAHHGVRLVSAAQSGCGVGTTIPLDGNGHQFGYARRCPDLVPRLQKELVTKRPRVILWYSGRDRYDMLVGGRVVKAGSPEWIRRKFADWDTVLGRLTSGGGQVVVVLPIWGVGDAREGCHGEFSFDPAACGRYYATTEHMRRLYAQWAAQHPHQVTLADSSHDVCPTGPPCPKIVDGIQLRADGVHYSKVGGRWLAPQMIASIPGLKQLFG